MSASMLLGPKWYSTHNIYSPFPVFLKLYQELWGSFTTSIEKKLKAESNT